MKALIWRELRVLRWAVIAMAGAMVIAVGAEAWLSSTRPEEAGGVMYLWYAVLVFCALGLGATAGCARERSAEQLEFSWSLPIDRRQSWLIRLGAGVVILAAFVAVTTIADPSQHVPLDAKDSLSKFSMGAPGIDLFPPVLLSLSMILLAYAAGFLASWMVAQPLVALVVGGFIYLVTQVIGVAIVDFFAGRLLGPRAGASVLMLQTTSCAAALLAATMLALASWRALRLPPLESRIRGLRLALGALGLLIAAAVAFALAQWAFGGAEPADFRQISEARISPDGRTIALTDAAPSTDWLGAFRWAGGRLWLIDADGANLRPAGRWDVQDPVWPPDSRGLVCNWGVTARHRSTWMLDTETGAWRRLFGGLGWEVEISPGGRYLAGSEKIYDLQQGRVVWHEGGGSTAIIGGRGRTIYSVLGWAEDDSEAYVRVSNWDADDMVQIVSLPSGEVTGALVDYLQSFSHLSPHGRFVAAESGYDEDAAVSVISVEDPTKRLVLDGLTVPNEPWSPDGRYLWLAAPEGFAVVDAERMEVASEIPSESAGVAAEDWGLVANPEHWIDRGVWSPDGSRFALSISGIPPRESGSGSAVRILVANADGSSARTVGDFRGLRSLTVSDWAADGRLLVIEDRERLAFIDPENGEREVVLAVR